VTPPKFRPLGQPDMRFADAKIMTKYHTFWVAGRVGGRTSKNDVGLSLFCCITEGHRRLRLVEISSFSVFLEGEGVLRNKKIENEEISTNRKRRLC